MASPVSDLTRTASDYGDAYPNSRKVYIGETDVKVPIA